MRSKKCPVCNRVVRKGQKWGIKRGKVVHAWCKAGNVKCPHCSYIFAVGNNPQDNIANVMQHMAIEHRSVFAKAMENL